MQSMKYKASRGSPPMYAVRRGKGEGGGSHQEPAEAVNDLQPLVPRGVNKDADEWSTFI